MGLVPLILKKTKTMQHLFMESAYYISVQSFKSFIKQTRIFVKNVEALVNTFSIK